MADSKNIRPLCTISAQLFAEHQVTTGSHPSYRHEEPASPTTCITLFLLIRLFQQSVECATRIRALVCSDPSDRTRVRSDTLAARLGIRQPQVRERCNRDDLPQAWHSLANSPWIRGAPHSGFPVVIVLTRARIAELVVGRPGRLRRESRVLCWRSHWRCHLTTASGCTTIKAECQSCQALARRIQDSRSVERNCGRFTVRVSAANG